MSSEYGIYIEGANAKSTAEQSSIRNLARNEEIARVVGATAGHLPRPVETGMLSVNSSSSVHIEAPFGGVKLSGIGHEHGLAALAEYSEYKTVFIADD